MSRCSPSLGEELTLFVRIELIATSSFSPYSWRHPEHPRPCRSFLCFGGCREIGRALKGYTVVITKSTVPVGTNRKAAERIRAVNPEADFDVVSNPEFVRKGATTMTSCGLIGRHWT